MLVDTKLTSHVFLIQDRCAPQASNDAQCVYERLPATEGYVCLDVEEVVGRPMRLAVYRCAIGQRQVDEWCMDATEQGSVVCQIAPAYRDRRIEGYLTEIVVAVMTAFHPPRIATDDTMKPLDGVDDSGGSLAQKTTEATCPVVKNRTAQAVSHFTDGHTATGGGKDVVDGWWIGLAKELPHGRTEQGVGCRLPICQPIGTRCIKVEVAVIRVHKHVHVEIVVIPHHTSFEVLADSAQCSLRKIFSRHIAVKQLYANIDTRYLSECPPGVLLAWQRHCGVAIYQAVPTLSERRLQRVVAVARLAQRHAQFYQRTVPIGLIAIIVAGDSPAYRGKDPQSFRKLIVGIDASLQRVQAFRGIIAVLSERLYMVIAYVTADAQLRSQLPILSQTIEQRTGELGIESHEVRSHTENAICALVTIACGDIHLGR